MHHPSRDILERFSCAGLSDSDAQWIVRHLRAGCRQCQPVVDSILQPAADTDHHDHHDQDDQDSAWEQLFAALGERVTLITAERQQAPHKLAQLMALDAAERPAAVRRQRGFQTLALCELLVQASGTAGGRDSGEAASLAELAILVAQQLDRQHYGSAVVHDLQGRAWIYLGHARRLAADLAGARHALAIAETLAEKGSADPLEEARLLDLSATLLAEEGNLAAAAETLAVVAEIYEDVQDLQSKAHALIRRADYLGSAGQARRAAAALEEALSQIEHLASRGSIDDRGADSWDLRCLRQRLADRRRPHEGLMAGGSGGP